jgi:(2R)-3-sulfolactate dehydrogenase (NADP+)
MVIVLDPAHFGAANGGDPKARIDELARKVAATGGRLPGASRTAPTRIPDEMPLSIADSVRDALHRMAV